MNSWKSRLVCGLVFLFVSEAPGEDKTISLPVSSSQIVDQRLYSVNACAPASLLNVLKFGDADLSSGYESLLGRSDANKLRYIVDRYFRTRPSTIAKGRKRWGVHGVYVEDFAQSCHDLLAELKLENCESSFLDRRSGEGDREQVLRVHEWLHDSLERGFPPVLSLRSFVVRSRPENELQPKWERGFHHFVVVYSVPAEVPEGATGFEVKVIDSSGKKLSSIYIHPEPNQQPFTVLKGNDIKGSWISGRPFLLVAAPGMNALRPVNLKWSERYLITANFLIGRF